MPKLTKSFCENLRFPGDRNPRSPFTVFDSELRGFGVRITGNGIRSFILKYRAAGRQRELTIGRFGELPVALARKKALEALASINEGLDPKAESDSKKFEVSFAELCSDYITKKAVHLRTSKEHERRVKRNLTPTLGKKPVSMITRADIRKIHEGMKECPYEGNRTLMLVSAIYKFAVEAGYIAEQTSHWTKGITKYPERKRQRWLHGEELQRFLEALAKEPNPVLRGAILFLLNTGLRKNEALRLTWDRVDFANEIVRIPQTKNNEPFTAPLSPQAMQILREMQALAENEWVFPSHKRPGAPLTEPKFALRRACERAGISDVRLHDLRRSFGSNAVSAGLPLEVVSHLLNHKSIHTTRSVYGHLSVSPLRKATERIGNVLSIEKIKERKEESA